MNGKKEDVEKVGLWLSKADRKLLRELQSAHGDATAASIIRVALRDMHKSNFPQPETRTA